MNITVPEIRRLFARAHAELKAEGKENRVEGVAYAQRVIGLLYVHLPKRERTKIRQVLALWESQHGSKYPDGTNR